MVRGVTDSETVRRWTGVSATSGKRSRLPTRQTPATCVVILLIATGCTNPQAADPSSGSATPTTSSASAPSSAAPPAPSATPAPNPRATPGATSAKPTRTTKPRDREGIIISAAGSQFGSILYDDSGQAIYAFDAERDTRPRCYGDCADAWPPVLTKGQPQRTRTVRQDLLGTTRRRDGALQATYAGRPLYFYADEGKYEVLCHNVEGFGGTWLAVQPNGKPAPI